MKIDLKDCENAGSNEETLESAGCTGGCPTYPGAPRTEDGFPDCSKCPQTLDRISKEQK